MNMNKVMLNGRLTKDVDLRYTPSGVAVCTFTLAVNQRKKENNESKADFITCVAFKNDAENMAKFLRKGSKVSVFGRLSSRTYVDSKEVTHYVTEVIVSEVEFLDPVNSDSSNNSRGQNNNQGAHDTNSDPFGGSEEFNGQMPWER